MIGGDGNRLGGDDQLGPAEVDKIIRSRVERPLRDRIAADILARFTSERAAHRVAVDQTFDGIAQFRVSITVGFVLMIGGDGDMPLQCPHKSCGRCGVPEVAFGE